MEGWQFLGLVSYGGEVRRRGQYAALASEEETPAVYSHPSRGEGGASPDWRPLLDPLLEEGDEAALQEAFSNVAAVKRKKPRRSVSLAAAMAQAYSWIRGEFVGESAFPTSVPWTMTF
ncbi:unnamed protein product [Spirodela intermedia]|uniref:Uncharacterized protein n=1 Tax=Spirodela intermedia TaxID=51605 RepID=A0A7I8IFV9_SPIIN|nr:unnamed protein product [Spirodela intermedia]CAA6656521.1 unnamed protein product [Spirodela intermedia]